MNRKPWPILALALFQWASPIGDWLSSSWASHLSPIHYLALAVAEEGAGGYLFHAWVPAILGGIAVYRVKPWSYPVFLGCIFYSSYRSAMSGLASFGPTAQGWLAHPGVVALWVLSLLVNLALGAWFLLPELRRPFLNRSLRWWEAAPRFSVTLSARVFPALSFKKGASVKILNISRGGALLEFRVSPALEPGDLLLLGFPATLSRAANDDETPWVFTEARIVHRVSKDTTHRIGVTFCGMSGRSRKSLRGLLRACRSLDLPRLREETGLWADLRYWWRRGTRTGGVTPAEAPLAESLASVAALSEVKQRAA